MSQQSIVDSQKSRTESGEVAIRVENLSKVFKLPHEKHNSIKSLFINFWRNKQSFELQKALSNVSFEVSKGEFFGIVGKNGSGKSTLLKLISGIYSPTKGQIIVNGKLTPFIELGVGFNPELTGRENIFLNGALLGLNRKEMLSMYNDIVQFAELEKFMDQKLKNYSSGMQVRLAFSIAIRAKSDILLFDEVLAVGDAAFQQKCFEVFAELKKQGTTIVLVTHDMSSVLRFCDRVILLDNGRLVKDGLPAVVADSYLELNFDASLAAADSDSELPADKKSPSIISVEIKNSAGKLERKFEPNENMELIVNFKNPKGVPLHFGIQIFNDAGVYCFGTNTKISGQKALAKRSGHVSLDMQAQFVAGNYYVNAAAMNENATTVYHYKARAADLRVMKINNLEGIAMVEHSWKL